MPVTLPSAYGGLSRGLSQGFGMMNLIDRTKMQKEEVAQQSQYRNEMLALKKSEIERTAKYQEYAKWADNTKTFLGNIKDKPYTVQIQGLNRYISSIPDSLPNLKKSLQGVNLVDKAALQEEIKTANDTVKALREGTPEALFSVSANHVGTKGADLAFNMGKNIKNENKATKLKKLLLERNALPKDDPNRKIYDTAIQKETTRSGMKVYDSSGNLIVDTSGGSGGMTTPVKTQIQKDVVNLETQLADLRVVGNDFKKEYLTYGGKIKRFALREANKVGIDIGEGGEKFIQGARKFQEGVEQVFNTYRKEITGAQAAMKEIAMLRESILNKKLAPAEFEASYNNYINKIQRQLSLKRMFLSQGINPQDVGKKIDDIVVSEKGVNMKAPVEAISYLMKNPDLKNQFKDKYGYIPRGM